VRLIMWLLSVGAQIPALAVPDVVSLYFNWSLILMGKDFLTPVIIQWFYHWLSQLQAPLQLQPGGKRVQPFNGELSSGDIKRMTDDLRTGFLLFCNLAPNLAADYLNKLKEHPYRDNAIRELLKFRGTLAQAAPKELAELTAEYLFPKEDDEEDDYEGPFADAFRHVDLSFVPASPAQGPFHELLVNAPQYALPLIRRIVDRAIEFRTKGQDYGKDVMVIVYPDGREVPFPWHR